MYRGRAIYRLDIPLKQACKTGGVVSRLFLGVSHLQSCHFPLLLALGPGLPGQLTATASASHSFLLSNWWQK